MPAISFQGEWLDMLLSSSKQQTTRKQTGRVKVGDIAHIYIEQRRRIADKPPRPMTCVGHDVMCERSYPKAFGQVSYPAHFLGKVVITEVRDIRPCELSKTELVEWAWDDGFDTFSDANTWFTDKYGDEWMFRAWTVIRWGGWAERYFEAKP